MGHHIIFWLDNGKEFDNEKFKNMAQNLNMISRSNRLFENHILEVMMMKKIAKVPCDSDVDLQGYYCKECITQYEWLQFKSIGV